MFARTERLLLRPGWIEDAPALAAAIADEAIVTKLSRVPWPYRLEDAEAFLGASQPADASANDLPRFLIWLRTHGAPKLIGGIGLQRTETGAELGYWIVRDYWGLGFATEAARAVVALADESLRLPTLEAGHFVDNPASGRVLQKLGFQPTGRTTGLYSTARGAIAPSLRYERRAMNLEARATLAA
ncbi:GNAT family N-acetyltransferase [Sphingomonas oleivorans]|uniref:GNAT family N-acetyltransferase n=1 Tax=Sphingomonas oleivorans TaxID=1735121 RepID=A0A2T5FU23_9SPHN|nr:GNAT family N-acetyltransferase [Sphingomonas oleivorans]PTQ07788.1 GNAT family N-acetyltransferase [Sphingomonas oleivorans]